MNRVGNTIVHVFRFKEHMFFKSAIFEHKIVSNPTSAILCFIVSVFISLLHFSVLTMIFPPVSVGDVSQHPFIIIICFFFLNCAIYSTLRNYVYWYVCIYCRYNHKCFPY